MADNTIKNDNKTTDYLDPETKKFKEGNPGGGRPKGSGISITTEIKKKLDEVPPEGKSTYLQLLINRIFKQAIQDGDQQMIKNIWNYVDGMPKQNTTIDGQILTGPIPMVPQRDGKTMDTSSKTTTGTEE